jgi:hypothetical protein
VDGWVNDRFSMSDYEGYLRIGTTRGGWWGEGISNQLAVLSEGDGKLVERGKLTGLGQGERIYSMRFDRDRGYMVTFRRTDPLFTLDLRDPANPRVAGELEVNGFSTYMHLLGTDRLLTIGRSADATGRVTGNKLQLRRERPGSPTSSRLRAGAAGRMRSTIPTPSSITSLSGCSLSPTIRGGRRSARTARA